MVRRVGDTPINSERPQPQVNRSVPPGIGEVPDRMQPVQVTGGYKLGYVETFVYLIRGWIIWVLRKVFPCFFPESSPLTELTDSESSPSIHERPPLANSSEQSETLPSIQTPQLRKDILAEADLLENLDSLTNHQKNRVYFNIGKEYCLYRPRHWFSSYEEIGRNEVNNKPMILQKYLSCTKSNSNGDGE